jgi:hypothetical protein
VLKKTQENLLNGEFRNLLSVPNIMLIKLRIMDRLKSGILQTSGR